MKKYDNQWIKDAIMGKNETIEDKIRNIQKDIIKIKKGKKGMTPNMKIVSSLLDDSWQQDRIEKIRDNKGG